MEVGVLLGQPCPVTGRVVASAGVYGPHDDDPARQWTEVYWLLA